MGKKGKEKKYWLLVIVLLLVALIFLGLCTPRTNEPPRGFYYGPTEPPPEEYDSFQATVTQTVGTIESVNTITPISLEPTIEPTRIPLGEVIILSPANGQVIEPETWTIGNQTGDPNWILSAGAPWFDSEPHPLIWQEYPQADEYFIFSRSPVTGGELACDFSSANSSDACEGGQCTDEISICRPACNGGNTIVTVFACYGNCNLQGRNQVIGVGQVQVVGTWEATHFDSTHSISFETWCERNGCGGPCRAEVEQPILETYLGSN